MTMVRLEELGLLKTSNDLSCIRTRYFPAYGIVPQPTTLQRTYITKGVEEIAAYKERLKHL
jgi:hypothetical protein